MIFHDSVYLSKLYEQLLIYVLDIDIINNELKLSIIYG